MNSLNVNEMRILFNRVIDKLENEEVNEVIIKNDFYRFIPADKWDTYDENITEIGSLQDDLNSLKKLVLDPDRIVTFVDFDRIASILHQISYQMNPPDPPA